VDICVFNDTSPSLPPSSLRILNVSSKKNALQDHVLKLLIKVVKPGCGYGN
jgi:hypothetical protein